MVSAEAIFAARLARVDPPRAEPKVRVRIDSAVEGLVECGIVIPHGVSEHEVYVSDVARLERLVERDRDAQQAAVEDHKRHVREVSERKETSRPYRPSLEASFRAVARRDMLPLRSVERLDRPQEKTGKT